MFNVRKHQVRQKLVSLFLVSILLTRSTREHSKAVKNYTEGNGFVAREVGGGQEMGGGGGGGICLSRSFLNRLTRIKYLGTIQILLVE